MVTAKFDNLDGTEGPDVIVGLGAKRPSRRPARLTSLSSVRSKRGPIGKLDRP